MKAKICQLKVRKSQTRLREKYLILRLDNKKWPKSQGRDLGYNATATSLGFATLSHAIAYANNFKMLLFLSNLYKS